MAIDGISSPRPSITNTTASTTSSASTTAPAPPPRPSAPPFSQSSFAAGQVASKPAVAPNQAVNFLSPEGKKQLIENSSQVNPISLKAHNSNDVCGGAALANALVMSSSTPEQAKANAEALRAAAGNLTGLSAAEKTAVDNMAKGTMSPTDLQNVQQLCFRLVKSQNPVAAQANPGEVGMAATLLKANGAFAGAQSIEFHESRLPPPGTANHWSVSVDGNYANSLNPQGDKGASMSSQVPDRAQMQASNSDWRGGVTIQNYANPPTIDIAYRETNAAGQDVPGTMKFNSLTNPEQYKMGSKTDFTPIDNLVAKIGTGGTSMRMGDTRRGG